MAAAPGFNAISLESDGDQDWNPTPADSRVHHLQQHSSKQQKKDKKKTPAKSKTQGGGSRGGSLPGEGSRGGALPGEAILGKDLDVMGMYTASLAAWVSLGVLLVSTLLHIIAYSCNGWVWVYSSGVAGDVRREVGLWQECHSNTGCYYFGVSQLSDAFRATQAFATFTLLALFAAVVLSILYLFFMQLRSEPLLGLILVGLHAASVLFLFLIMCIFGARWSDKKYNSPGYSGTLHWCYAFECLAFFSQLAATGFIVYEVLLLNRPAKGTEDPYLSENHG